MSLQDRSSETDCSGGFSCLPLEPLLGLSGPPLFHAALLPCCRASSTLSADSLLSCEPRPAGMTDCCCLVVHLALCLVPPFPPVAIFLPGQRVLLRVHRVRPSASLAAPSSPTLSSSCRRSDLVLVLISVGIPLFLSLLLNVANWQVSVGAGFGISYFLAFCSASLPPASGESESRRRADVVHGPARSRRLGRLDGASCALLPLSFEPRSQWTSRLARPDPRAPRSTTRRANLRASSPRATSRRPDGAGAPCSPLCVAQG